MTKKDVITKEDIEEYYNKCRKIKFTKRDEINDKFIYKSLKSIYNNIKDSDNSLPTVYVKEGHHCYQQKIRSLDDYIRLCKYYFPDETVKTIVNSFIKFLQDEHDDDGWYLDYCYTIRKDNLWRNYGYSKNHVKNTGNKLWKNQGFKNCNLNLNEIN